MQRQAAIAILLGALLIACDQATSTQPTVIECGRAAAQEAGHTQGFEEGRSSVVCREPEVQFDGSHPVGGQAVRSQRATTTIESVEIPAGYSAPLIGARSVIRCLFEGEATSSGLSYRSGNQPMIQIRSSRLPGDRVWATLTGSVVDEGEIKRRVKSLIESNGGRCD